MFAVESKRFSSVAQLCCLCCIAVSVLSLTSCKKRLAELVGAPDVGFTVVAREKFIFRTSSMGA